MRNLKAWDPSAKRMNEIRGYVDNKDTTKIFYAGMGGFCSYPKDKIVILEGTGEEDIKEKEIFKGDIVKVSYGTGIVVFSSGCFMIEWIDDTECLMELLSMKVFKTGRPRKDIEIIGNIYQNPELK